MQSQHTSKSNRSSQRAPATPRPSQIGTHLEVPGQSVRHSARPPVVGTSGISAREQAAGGGYRQSGAHLDSARSSQSNKPLAAAGLQAPSAQRASNTAGSYHSDAPASHHSNAPPPYRSNAARAFHGGATTSRTMIPSHQQQRERATGAMVPVNDRRGVGMQWKMDAPRLAPLRPGEKRQYVEVTTTTARIVEEKRD